MSQEHPAEAKISVYGITSPRDIDVDAIAYDLGVEVRYDVLSGCEATLVGVENRAIATIQQNSGRPRQRFSIGHELGHWHHHRGESFRCRVDDVSDNLAIRDKRKEQEADDFAAHLLMPGNLFKPLIKQAKRPSFSDLRAIASEFDTSLLATALRFVGVNTLPAILTCYNKAGLRWFRYSADVPRRWYLVSQLDEDSFAYELLFNGRIQNGFRKSGADTWFTNDDGESHELIEHSTLGRAGEVLTLIIPDASMLEARFDRGEYPRRRSLRD